MSGSFDGRDTIPEDRAGPAVRSVLRALVTQDQRRRRVVVLRKRKAACSEDARGIEGKIPEPVVAAADLRRRDERPAVSDPVLRERHIQVVHASAAGTIHARLRDLVRRVIGSSPSPM
jgi:hypothetical protein